MHFLDLIMKYRDHIFNFYSSSDVLPVILKRSQNVTAKKYWLDLLWSFPRFKTRLRGFERLAVPRQMGRWEKKRLRRETAFPSLPCALFSPTSFFDDILKQKRDEDGERIRERNPSLKEEGGRALLPHGQTKV